MVNHTLDFNKVFREQVKECLKYIFNTSNIYGIRNVMKKNTCVIALVTFYDNRTTYPMKVFTRLSFALYSVIENYICIDYLYCQYKTLRAICYDKMFASVSYT